ncbi:hypothetical protein LWF01_19140 [Saxibacter everestensis]|uniref:Membrane protein involved in the export of O-antigen and teichoic acid n=1 Tax=Saxibacter everestensis TaxID=2909229 RepID=A0ABY8QT22_9MICO|nr:hypothetical protein LWF01_19140 [Brevibacteriaceae bacterium ZFBP1038]
MSSPKSADLRTAAAAVVAMLPGFLFPFILTLAKPASVSDSIMLALSIVTTLTSAVGTAIELNTVSEFGRQLSDGRMPSTSAMVSYRRRVYVFGLLTTGIVGPLLALLYAVGSDRSTDFLIVCGLMLGVSVITVFSSVQSGILIAHGEAGYAVALQFLRPTLPSILIIAWPAMPLLLLPLAFVLGEAVRYGLLSWKRNRILSGYLANRDEKLESRGMLWQSFSAGMSQGAPIIDRVFLNAGPTGSISMYELADKLYFAAAQFLNYGFLVRRVGRWSRIPTMTQQDARKLLRKDLTVVLGAAAVIAVVGITAASVLQLLPLPSIWSQSLSWAMVLFASAPLTMWIMSASRLIVIARRQRLLPWLSALTLATNLVLDIIFFSLWGVFGIVLATLGLRVCSAIVYAIVLWRILPSMTAPLAGQVSSG